MTIPSETLPELRVQIVNFHDEKELRPYDECQGFIVSFDGQKAKVRVVGICSQYTGRDQLIDRYHACQDQFFC